MSGIFIVGNILYFVYNGRLVNTTHLSEVGRTTQTAITVENVNVKEYLEEIE